MPQRKPLTYIDLFAGAGGLSEGFIRSGFKPIAHVEKDTNACNTLRTRIAYHHLKSIKQDKIYDSYLKEEITREELYKQVPEDELNTVINAAISKETQQEIFHKIDGILKEEKRTVDVIIGGPPCQAYSVIGRSRDPNRMKNDPRNYLFKDYIAFLKKYKPKVFIFENVRGLLSAGQDKKYLNEMIQGFKEAGYTLDYKILNAANFGVLQYRERVIIIGWQKKLNLTYPEFKDKPADANIQDIFNDLPPIKPNHKVRISSYIKEVTKTHYLLSAQIRNGRDFVTQHQTRPHNSRDLEIYRRTIELWENESKRLKYNQLPKSLITHKNLECFQGRFRVVDPNGYSHTVLAHLSKDGHYFIHPSLKQLRSISIREAARIQSFPDDYFFEGGQGPAFKQIGNAVPPLMAERIAKEIKGMMGS